MPLPRLFTQFPDPCCSLRHCLPLCPPYFSHNFIFYPPPRCSFSSFSCTSRHFPALFGLPLSSLFCLLVFPLLASILLSYLLLLPFRLSLPTLRPSLFFCLFLTSPFPPPFPCLLVFLTSSPPPPCISSNPPPLPHPPLASLLQSYNCGHDGP